MAGENGASFRPVLARYRSATDEAKVTWRGPRFSYVGQPDEDPPYETQKFFVSKRVRQGDVLGIQARRTSLINCSGAFLPQYQPALPPGGPFEDPAGGVGCTLLIEPKIV